MLHFANSQYPGLILPVLSSDLDFVEGSCCTSETWQDSGSPIGAAFSSHIPAISTRLLSNGIHGPGRLKRDFRILLQFERPLDEITSFRLNCNLPVP